MYNDIWKDMFMAANSELKKHGKDIKPKAYQYNRMAKLSHIYLFISHIVVVGWALPVLD